MNENVDPVVDLSVHGSSNTSNQDRAVEGMPPEVLGSCFELLPLRDGVRASHVSRYWRSVALSTPRMWSTISMECLLPGAFKLLELALSRAGRAPIDLDIFSQCSTPHGAFDPIIRPHMHRLRSLELQSQVSTDTLRAAAPLLEYLHIHGRVPTIPDDFLRGGAGRLRTLLCGSVRLPLSCPALSTVVDLRIYELETIGHARSLSRLFDFFPRLESLTLHTLRDIFAHLLPSGPPPTSLRRISLETKESGYDLTRLYVAWNTPNLREVCLDMVNTVHAHPIPAPLLGNAVVLNISKPQAACGLWIVAELSDGGEHAIGVPDEMPIPRLAELVLGASDRLQRVHTLNVNLAVLKHSEFTNLFAALPALTHISIYLQSPGWSALGRLEGVLRVLPRLEALVIAVEYTPGRRRTVPITLVTPRTSSRTLDS